LEANAQLKERFVPFLELSYNKVLNPDNPGIRNFPHPVSKWSALDVEQFSANSKDRPLYYRLPLSINAGLSIETSRKNDLTISLGYNHFSRVDTLGQKLRYSDQVDPVTGFVGVSNYNLTKGYHIYRSIGLDVIYLVNDEIGNYVQRIGLGIGVQRLLGSSYFLNFNNYNLRSQFDYTDNDITIKDKIWIINPCIAYQAKLFSTEIYNYWLTTCFKFPLQDKYKLEPMGQILNLGLRLEFR
jgi:hypothetical protein